MVYQFECKTVTENFLYHVHCDSRHEMRMLRVPEEATKQCLQTPDTQYYGVRKQYFPLFSMLLGLNMENRQHKGLLSQLTFLLRMIGESVRQQMHFHFHLMSLNLGI